MEWATDARGRLPAREFYEALSDEDRAKASALFRLLADTGKIHNREKFKSLGAKGRNLHEFKSFQLRLVGDFRRGHRFLVAHGVRKKKNDLSRADIETALRVLRENDQNEERRP